MHGFRKERKKMEQKKFQKRQRKMQTRLDLKKARAERIKAFEARLEKLKMPAMAKDMIKIYDLPANPQGRSILRLELQRGFLQSIAKELAAKKQRLPFKEQFCLGLITDAGKIQLILWKYAYGGIPLRQAHEMYSSAARILKNANIAVRGDKELMEGFGKEGRNVAKTAEELRREISRGTQGKVKPESPKELLQIAEAGEDMAMHAFDYLPEYAQTGLEKIEKIIESEMEEPV